MNVHFMNVSVQVAICRYEVFLQFFEIESEQQHAFNIEGTHFHMYVEISKGWEARFQYWRVVVGGLWSEWYQRGNVYYEYKYLYILYHKKS
jgi:hypothetical protein